MPVFASNLRFRSFWAGAGVALVFVPGGCGGGGSNSTSSGLGAPTSTAAPASIADAEIKAAEPVSVSAPLARNRVLRVTCVGDSITFGVGVSNRARCAYPAVLEKSLGSGYRVENFGYSGATMSIATATPYQKLPIYRAALASKPDIVVVALGTNDAALDFNAQRQALFVKDYKKLIGDFRQVAGAARLYLCIPPSAYGPSLFRASVIQASIAPLIRQIAAETATPVIDLFTPTSRKPELFPDSLHPDDAGARKLAAEIKRALIQS